VRAQAVAQAFRPEASLLTIQTSPAFWRVGIRALQILSTGSTCRLQSELLRTPVEEFGDTEFILGWTSNLVNPSELA